MWADYATSTTEHGFGVKVSWALFTGTVICCQYLGNDFVLLINLFVRFADIFGNDWFTDGWHWLWFADICVNDWFADILAMTLINLLIFCQWLWLWFADIWLWQWLFCWESDILAILVSMTVVFVPTAYLPLQQMCACLPAKSWSGCATFPNVFIKRRAQRQYPLLLCRGNW